MVAGSSTLVAMAHAHFTTRMPQACLKKIGLKIYGHFSSSISTVLLCGLRSFFPTSIDKEDNEKRSLSYRLSWREHPTNAAVLSDQFLFYDVLAA